MKLYIGITASMSSVSYICVLSISLMESVNGAKFLNITFLFALFVAVTAVEVFATVIILLRSMYILL